MGKTPEKLITYVGFVPLAEGRSVDLDNGALNESVRSHKFVIRRIVRLPNVRGEQSAVIQNTYDTNDPGLPCYLLRGPGKVATIKTEGTVLEVSTTNTDGMDALGSELGVSGLTTELELSLFTVVGALGSRSRALVS